MKKIVFLITLLLIGSLCIAQRNGNPPTRSSSSRPHTSMSRSSSVPTRSSTATYSPSRSSSRNVGISHSSSKAPSRSSSVYRRSETRSTPRVENRTPPVRNTPRMENNRVNERPVNHVRHSEGVRPHNNHPHHTSKHYHAVPHGMHPMPPMHHPIHHRPIYMHYHLYDRDYWFVHNLYWHGYWNYVHTNPYNEVIVYVNNTRPGTETLAIVTDDNYIYTLYRDNYMNETYFTISDENDNVLVKTVVHKKYCKLITDGNGVWLLKKRDRDPIYFMYQDGNLYRYEED